MLKWVSEHEGDGVREGHLQTVRGGAFVMGLVFVAVLAVNPEWIDVCAMDTRERLTATQSWTVPSQELLLATQIFICLCLLLTAGHSSLEGHHRPGIVCLCVLLWYWGSASFVIAAKYILMDQNCSHHANSVSGHTHFYLFACLNLPRVVVGDTDGRHPPAFVRVAIAGCYLIVVLLCVFQGYRTLAYGFHTVRQMLYGAAFSFAASLAWIMTYFRTHTEGDLIRSSVTVAVSGIVVCTMVHKLPTTHLVSCSGTWLLAMYLRHVSRTVVCHSPPKVFIHRL